jgi:hypothetical protein
MSACQTKPLAGGARICRARIGKALPFMTKRPPISIRTTRCSGVPGAMARAK